MTVLRNFSCQLVFYAFVLLLSFDTQAEIPPINIQCPCEIERINQTKAKVSLAIAFQKEVIDSGDLSIRLHGATKINSANSSYYLLGDLSLKSIPYSLSPIDLVVEVPLNFRPEVELFMSLVLNSGDNFVDQVNFLEEASPYFNPGGSAPDVTSNLIFNSDVSFAYNSSTFTLDIPSASSTDLKSESETLNLEIRMYNESNTRYYVPAAVEYQVNYDLDGNTSFSVSGNLDYSIDNTFQNNPDFPNLVLNIARNDTRIMRYALDVLGNGELADLAQTWTNIDTLLDSDGDGVSDFNERILGTNSLIPNEVPKSVIEIAFTAGSNAEASYLGGSNLSATITHHIAVANAAFKDSGLAIELKEVGIYSVGDDSDLDADAVLAAMKARDGIFTDLDELLERQPDLFMHYSTVDVINTGGKASVLGSRNDGIIDYKTRYLDGSNRGVVSIGNVSITLGHEVGHLLGLTHSRKQNTAVSTGTFPWSLGHGIDNNFSTVMAYASEFNASGLGIFSSPNLSCGEAQQPCGIERFDQFNGADAVRSLQTTTYQVSAISNGVAPVLTLLGNNPEYISNVEMASELQAQASDREDGDITDSISSELIAITISDISDDEYDQIYMVTDSERNTSKISRRVIVVDEDMDTDADGIPDYLDDDDDGDGVLDEDDAFPKDSSETIDTDGDGIGDNSDAFPQDETESLDSDGDGIGNNSDPDDDNDGVSDQLDDLPLNSNETKDTDGDGIGNNADPDDDNDTLSDDDELVYGTNPLLSDTDFDGLPDAWEVQNLRSPTMSDYDVATGISHSCGIDDNGVICWGSDLYGKASPPSLSNPNQVVAGFSHSCALSEDGVACWGNNRNGRTDPPQLLNPRSISSIYTHTCALDDNGVSCWGDNDSGQISVPDLINPTQVSAGEKFTCAIDETGVVCWGENRYGDTQPPTLSNPVQISVGRSAACALDDTGIVCWGALSTESGSPSGRTFTKVESGSLHACANNGGEIECWGNRYAGSLSVPIPTLKNVSQISAADHTCVLNNSGVVCWGDGTNGEQDVPNLTIDPDQDGYNNQGGLDAFPLDKLEWLDTDSDGTGNNADTDDDDDGVLDENDAFPLNAGESEDTDDDGIGNNSDIDDDGDGVSDDDDAFPLDSSETVDSDFDGVGDNSDSFPNDALYSIDSDSDGMPDEWETRYGLDPNDPSDAISDRDNDGVTALDEFLAGTIPSGSLDIDGNEDYDALTDGLLLLRGMFGLDGSALVTGTIASDAAYTESVDIEARIETLGDLADIDGNGDIDALTDGLLTLRYLFGLQGDTLINGVVADDATRTTSEEIEAHLETLMPSL
ncbi:MAG: M12 family metallo-peptidase [Porticoccaceae bacterium]|nr:M12 family metallo-peptidase [Porticoccaceae bacterium]